MKIKVCGLKDRENILEILEARPDHLGFIFYERSPRFAGGLDADFVHSIRGVKKVGVFVNEKEINILDRVARYGLDLVQLHGDETPEFCALVSKSVPVMKAFQVDNEFNFSVIEKYASACDYFLFDSKSENYGGSGRAFEHKKLEEYKLDKKVFLSGGLDLNITDDILYLRSMHPQVCGIDVNSRFEIGPGYKDAKKIKLLSETIRKYGLQG